MKWLPISLLVAVLAGPALIHLGALPPPAGFFLTLGAALTGLVAGPIAAWRGRQSVAGVLLGVLATVPAIALVAQAARAVDAAPLNDASTDPDDPPGFNHATLLPDNKDRDFAPPDAAAARAAWPDLAPLRTTADPRATLKAAEAEARARGWEILGADEAAGMLEAVDRTRLFRFADDIVVRLREDAGGTRVDVRSRSRFGGGDLGVNAARIRAYLAGLRARLPAAGTSR